MITFFVGIVFIAEMIIAYQLIALIKKCDTKISEINDKITAIRPNIDKSFCSLQIGINSCALAVNKIQIKLSEQKNKCKIIIIKHLLSLILLLTLNLNCKKVAAVFDLGIAINDFLKLARKSACTLEI
ncbi:hypothetical protein J6G99_01355 [bacterium]|nr:hypothetical protein [bacterium]